MTARTDADLTPDSIVRKVSDASGAKYSGDSMSTASSGAPPSLSSKPKPAFMPTNMGGASSLPSRTRTSVAQSSNADSDGWGADAPQVTRSQLEKVEPAYKPTKVNMAELTSRKQEPSRYTDTRSDESQNREDVVRGGYQPIGKVDIAAIRRQAQASGSTQDDRPAPVKGSYEPIGKVDIAAIRARAQPSAGVSELAPKPVSSSASGGDDEPKSLADRSAAFTSSERMTSLPKPKVANRFSGGASSFTGTKAPAPAGFGGSTIAKAAPVGVASRSFADEGGKTPAQIWAEKKARERGVSGASDTARPSMGSPVASQTSGGGEWKSGYSGKSWAPVNTTRTGQSVEPEAEAEAEEVEEEEPTTASGGIGALRDRFKNAAPMGQSSTSSRAAFEDDSAPSMDLASKPRTGGVGGIAMPGLPRRAPEPEQEDDDEIPAEESTRMPTPPAQPSRSPTPPTPDGMRSGSPIRVAMPVGRKQEKAIEPEEHELPPAMPTRSLAQAVPAAEVLEDEPEVEAEDPARGAAAAMAATSFGAAAAANAAPGAGVGGKSAIVQYDYEKAEENELELKEGETVTNIEMVDEDWWMGTNSQGESGLFPSNYVEIVEGHGASAATPAAPVALATTAPPAGPAGGASKAPTATAQYDYEAAEENELSFPEGATITNVVSLG